MLNNIQIYHIKAEDPVINNTSIGKQMHKGKENRQGKCLVGLESFFIIDQMTVYLVSCSKR